MAILAQMSYNKGQLNANERTMLLASPPVLTNWKATSKMAKTYSTPTQLPLPLDGETIEIKLTKGYVAIIDAIDSDLLQFKWYPRPEPNGRCYVHRNTKTKELKHTTQQLHIYIMQKIIGHPLEKGQVIDHIDNNPLNNRRSNLRICTNSENMKNKGCYRRNKLGLKGVYERHGKYRAQIQVDGKKLMLGIHNTPELAYAAYCEAAKKYHGEFARVD